MEGAERGLDQDGLVHDRERSEFLRIMYSVLWENINRHILVVWQPVAALFAAFAAMFLRQSGFLQPDFSTALVVTAAAWVIAHALDAGSWFSRNLALIRNIEREFLSLEDQRAIQPFFASGHRGTKLVEHFRIQVVLASVIWVLALLEHFLSRVASVWPGSVHERVLLALPYLLSAVALWGLCRLRGHYAAQHRILTTKSPGPSLRR